MASIGSMVDRFSEKTPVAVLARAALEHIFSDDSLEKVFEDNATRQYTRTLAFSSCFWLMVDVVTKKQPSLNAAYEDAKEQLEVSVQSVYNKIDGLELGILEQLVVQTAKSVVDVLDCWKVKGREVLPGIRCRIMDGNIMAGTDHRIGELRGTRAAALPGRSLCFYDPQYRIIDEVILDENGHAQDRSQFDEVLERVRKGECLIGDACFGTQKLMIGIDSRSAYFILRKPSNTAIELVGKRKKIGPSETGDVFEQTAILHAKDGSTLTMRQISIDRYEPTETGKEVVELLTNLPAKFLPMDIANAYRCRWRIENAFQDLATTLKTEITTLGYPSAALFGFCIGVVLQNMLSLIESSLQIANPKELKQTERLSRYRIALEIQRTTIGMEIAIEPATWTKRFGDMLASEFAAWALGIASKADVAKYKTSKWSPKGPPPKRKSGNRGNHVATSQMIEERRKSKT